MENLRKNNYIIIFGRIIFFTFMLSIFCRIFFREEYTRENHDYVTKVIIALAIVHLILKLKYNRESTLTNIKARLINIKGYLPEMVVIGLMLLLWFLYNKN